MAWIRELDEIELLEFFGAEPIDKMPQEGYWCYEASNNGVTLRFSYRVFDAIVQTQILVGDTAVSTVVHGGAQFMNIINGILACEFETENAKATLLISLDPFYANWVSSM